MLIYDFVDFAFAVVYNSFIMNIQLNEHFDFKKLIKFTIPSVEMMIFTSVYGVVDGVFVSNCVGSGAFASVNLIMPVIMLLGCVGFMIGTGGSALVSKTLGEGDTKRANKYFSMLIYFSVFLSFIITVFGMAFIKPLAIMLGAEGQILKDCIIYAVILLATNVFFVLQNVFQSFLIVAEKPVMGLWVSVAAGLTNIVGDFLFVYLFDWGVAGAAAATSISQFVGGLVPLLYFIFNKKNTLKLCKAKLEFKPILKSCTNGSSEMMTNISLSLVNILYNFQLMKIAGADGVVAYGIIMYISFVFVSAFIGYCIGSAPVISYHYGAGNTDELKNLLRKSLTIIFVSSAIMLLFSQLLSKNLAGIFVGYDENLTAMTVRAIRIYSISLLFSGLGIFGSAFFTALSNGLVSALISFFRLLFFQVLMIMTLPLIWGIDGVWSAVVFAELMSVIFTIWMIVKYRKTYGYF